jgi:hypothetical protein
MSDTIESIDYCTTKQWEKWWFKEFNKICLQCTKKCKQSDKVTLNCPQYQKISE